ncbi:unnamed protein product [Vitrella brassicaformis CCMP3155]|uniref:Uncharacterized protein n=2 Tax=Vitrella brassicaformis TaxID=1169539 RepID=A0A0G4H2E4_VITBC|nr:unnamed protein product [Vitrella brassicaformis CCMP3155]|eukprot:CEM37759.1 unnamed protein product [Vitrella brassicaformis CCMP3155]
MPKRKDEPEEAPPASFDDIPSFNAFVEAKGTKEDLVGELRDLPYDEHDALWVTVADVVGPELHSQNIVSDQGEYLSDDARRVLENYALLLISSVEALASQHAHARGDGDQQQQQEVKSAPEGLLQTADACQSFFNLLPLGRPREQIGMAYERLCSEGFEGCESVQGGLLLFLLTKATSIKATQADVKRLSEQWDLLNELVYDGGANELVKQLLGQCAMTPIFFSVAYGRNFISRLFHLHESMPLYLLDYMKNYIKNEVRECREDHLKHYANILHKAWGDCTDEEIKLAIEDAVQDLMECALWCDLKVATKCRKVLQTFHDKMKGHHDCLDMLCRLYEPILWRSFKVANWKVRSNAFLLLAAAFPLLRPHAMTVSDLEDEKLKHYQIYEDGLTDDSEGVRRAAIRGVCKNMSEAWQVFTPEYQNKLVKLVLRCAVDLNSTAVRASVYEGLSELLEQPMTHIYVKDILKDLERFKPICDTSPKVRQAVAKYFDVISERISDINVFDYVSVPTIHGQLAKDHLLSLLESAVTEMTGSRPPKKSLANVDVTSVADKASSLMAKFIFEKGRPAPHESEQQARAREEKEMKERLNKMRELVKEYSISLWAIMARCQSLSDFDLTDRLVQARVLWQAINRRMIPKAVEAIGRCDEAAKRQAKKKGKKKQAVEPDAPDADEKRNIIKSVRVWLIGVRQLLAAKDIDKTTEEAKEALLKDFQEETFLEHLDGEFANEMYQVLYHLPLYGEHYPAVKDRITAQLIDLNYFNTHTQTVVDSLVPLAARWAVLEDAIRSALVAADERFDDIRAKDGRVSAEGPPRTNRAHPGRGGQDAAPQPKKKAKKGRKKKGGDDSDDEQHQGQGEDGGDRSVVPKMAVPDDDPMALIRFIQEITDDKEGLSVAMDVLGKECHDCASHALELVIEGLSADPFQHSTQAAPPQPPLSDVAQATFGPLLQTFGRLYLHIDRRLKDKPEGFIPFSSRLADVFDQLGSAEVPGKDTGGGGLTTANVEAVIDIFKVSLELLCPAAALGQGILPLASFGKVLRKMLDWGRLRAHVCEDESDGQQAWLDHWLVVRQLILPLAMLPDTPSNVVCESVEQLFTNLPTEVSILQIEELWKVYLAQHNQSPAFQDCLVKLTKDTLPDTQLPRELIDLAIDSLKASAAPYRHLLSALDEDQKDDDAGGERDVPSTPPRVARRGGPAMEAIAEHDDGDAEGEGGREGGDVDREGGGEEQAGDEQDDNN